MKFPAVIAVVLFVASAIGQADHCRQTQVIYRKPSVLTLAYYPEYGTVSAQQQGESNNTLLRQMVEEIRGLREDLALLKGGDAALTLEGQSRASCIKCHQEGNNPRGTTKAGFSLFDKDGVWIEPSLDDKKNMHLRVKTKDPEIRMPRDGFTDAKKTRYLEALTK